MAEKLEIYKCEICGNVVQVLISGTGELVCCNKNMKLLKLQKDDNEVGEKHSIRIKENYGRRFAYVENHPMINEHYIQFIEAIDKNNDELHLKYFYPDSKPEFDISNYTENLELKELCNIHELWGE